MTNSNKTIFLLKEQIRATKIAFRKKKNKINNTIICQAKEKKRVCENEIRALNKQLVIEEKEISRLSLSVKNKAKDPLVKKIEAPLIGELKNHENKINKLIKNLNEIKILLTKEIKNKKNTDKETAELKKGLKKNKRENSELKKQIQNNRLKITKLKKELSNTKNKNNFVVVKTLADGPNNLLLESCEGLYEVIDEIVNKNLNINQVTEAKKIYKMIMFRNDELKKTGKIVQNIFIQNT